MANFEIVTRKDFSDVTYLLEIRDPQLAKAAQPGQFLIVMEHETRRAHPAHHLRRRRRRAGQRHLAGLRDGHRALLVVNTTMGGLDGNLDDLMAHLVKDSKTFTVVESAITLYSATIGYSPLPDIVLDDLFLLRFKARMVLELTRIA